MRLSVHKTFSIAPQNYPSCFYSLPFPPVASQQVTMDMLFAAQNRLTYSRTVQYVLCLPCLNYCVWLRFILVTALISHCYFLLPISIPFYGVYILYFSCIFACLLNISFTSCLELLQIKFLWKCSSWRRHMTSFLLSKYVAMKWLVVLGAETSRSRGLLPSLPSPNSELPIQWETLFQVNKVDRDGRSHPMCSSGLCI